MLDDGFLIVALKGHMSQARLTQSRLARELRMDQGHLSKILSKEVHLAPKSRQKIHDYMVQVSPTRAGQLGTIEPAAELLRQGKIIMENMQKWLTDMELLCNKLDEDIGRSK
jgi:transcriptional regulator with XRE-family HTH domain